ncbi:MAG: hypothetical protein ACRENP_30110, partial [Longimicrobiales bacterium]
MAHRLFITSAVLVGAALPASAAAQSGGFLVMLGRDTVQVERFTRSADRIEGTVVFRSPRTRVVKYDLQLASNGTFTRYEQTIFSAEGKRIEPDAANATFTYVGDTIVRQTVRGTEPITQRIAAPNGAVPLLGSSLLVPFSYSFLTYELAVARARASAQNGESRLSLLGTLAALTTPQSTRVWLIGEDSAEVDYFGLARSGFKFDAQGR